MSSATAPTDTTRRRRPSRAVIVGAVALMAAALAVLAWLVLRDDDKLDPGPVGTQVRDRISWPQPAGKPFGYGQLVVFNRGDQDAVLESIAIADPPKGLEVLDTGIGGPKRRVTMATSLTWPAPKDFRDLHPVAGYRLSPDAPGGAQLVFALRARKPGRYVFTAITINYRVGDTHFRARVQNSLAVCAYPPDAARPKDCALPAST